MNTEQVEWLCSAGVLPSVIVVIMVSLFAGLTMRDGAALGVVGTRPAAVAVKGGVSAVL